MKIEIYGIPDSLHNCYACGQARKFLEERGIEYIFYPVLIPANNELGFDYYRSRIQELAKRLNSRGLAFTYPRIFVDNTFVGGFSNLKQVIGE